MVEKEPQPLNFWTETLAMAAKTSLVTRTKMDIKAILCRASR